MPDEPPFTSTVGTVEPPTMASTLGYPETITITTTAGEPLLMDPFVPTQLPSFPAEVTVADSTSWYQKRIENLNKPQIPLGEQKRAWLAMHRKLLGADLSRLEIKFLKKDLRRLQNHPRIALMRVGRRGIALKTTRVEPTLDYAGARYKVFLAIWALAIELFHTPQGTKIRAQLTYIASGSTLGQAPKYTHAGVGMGFCFGSNTEYVRRLLDAGALADGIEVILEWLWHVNPSDIQSVTQQYQLLEKVVTDPVEDAKPKPPENLFGNYGGLDDG